MRRSFNFLRIATLVIIFTLISCDRDENTDSDDNKCNVTNPAEEIAWLKEAIDNVKQDVYSYYVMANYKGETVFYYGNCNPAANYSSIVQNCSGENLGDTNDLYYELTQITILWKHEESKCNFQE